MPAYLPKRLAQSSPTTTAETTVYTTAGGAKAIIKQVLVANVLASPTSVSLSLVPSGGTAGDSNRVGKDVPIAANALMVFDLSQVLHAGDFISVKAGAANALTITISGVEFLSTALPTNGLEIAKVNTIIGTRPRLNLIEGANVTLTVVDDPGNNKVDVTIQSATATAGPHTHPLTDLPAALATDAEVAAGYSPLAHTHNSPVGMVAAFAGSTAPTGWLLCNGATVSQVTYAALFAVIAHTYGADPGGGNFILPNLKGKVVVGYNAAETEFDTLGETGGAKTHTLTAAQMPSHAHSFASVGNHGHGMEIHSHDLANHGHGNTGGDAPNHTHAQYGGYTTSGSHTHSGAGPGAAENPSPVSGVATGMGNTAGVSVPHTHSTGGPTNNTSGAPGGYTGGQPQAGGHDHSFVSNGSDTAHNNLQPYIALNYIIRAVAG